MPADHKHLNLLVVDDSKEDLAKFERLLHTADGINAEVEHAETGSEALNRCATRAPDCILLENYLTDMDGLEFLARLARKTKIPEIPVLMLTRTGSEVLAVEAMKGGALDYLNKNAMTFGQVTRAIERAINIVGLRRELKLTKEKLEQLAFYDSLTEIGNRNLFAERLDHGLTIAKRSSSILAVLLIDLDKFKAVNDTYGHAAGDTVLRGTGKRLHEVLRHSDTATRLGGDEFAVILETDVTEDGAQIVAQKIVKTLAEPFDHNGTDLSIGASIGISLFPEHANDEEQLMHCADLAMYQAKRRGGGFTVFAPSAYTDTSDELLVIC
jgi:diguanylate cyclase (GGDEF)-like protein